MILTSYFQRRRKDYGAEFESTALTVIVRFVPHRIGPNFFRLANAILGLILLGFAIFCAIVLSRYHMH